MKKKLSTVETVISHLSHEGRGIARIDGKTIFVAGALPGERVLFQTVRKRSQYDEGIVTEVLEASPDRVQPLCPHHDICGGCSLQYMSPTHQISHKQQVLLDKLQAQAHVQPQTVLEPLTASPWHYRNKARLGVRYVIKKEKVLVGFREINGRYIADIESCSVLNAAVSEKIPSLSELIASLSCFQDIPQIEVSCGDTDIALVFRHLKEFTEQDIEKLIDYAKQHSILLYLQPKGIDTIHKLWPQDGNDLLSYTLPNHNIECFFHPNDFTQINPEMNVQLIDRVIKLFDLKNSDTVLDLFCGLGNFTLPLARYAKNVIGIEGAESLVARAQANADHNNISNTEYYVADLTQDISATPWAQKQYNKILLDPPRTGAKELIEQLGRFKAERIIYVSCDPTTLARDTESIIQQGYTLTHAGVMDMFTHTKHVESIAVFDYGKN